MKNQSFPRKLLIGCGILLLSNVSLQAQNIKNNPTSNHGNAFEQLGTILPTPNSYRTASGDVGPNYWQQRADYDISCTLDQKKLLLSGEEKITYFNNSPGTLSYLWLQLDENEHSSVNNANYQDPSHISKQNIMDANALAKMETSDADNGLGDRIISITDAAGKPLHFVVNKTMMRIDLPKPLAAKSQYIFNIKWDYKITDRMVQGGRGGFEFFPEDKNYIFTMAQWYPRLCVYSDFQGWQNHQFTGRGEFALTFGNFKVKMTVPANHIVTGTGECKNYADVLTPAQMKRWQQAQIAKEPVEVVTLAEAKANEVSDPASKTKTWIFYADSVRDFAWTSSNKFIWDAMPTYVANKKIMCMSLYGKEAYSLYRKFSTKVVAHTIRSYSHFTIDYPYPVAQSIEASNGMEYPMICFNYGRTEKDGTYSEATKNGMIGVVIHEVGHNFFPMIVNSDERQWTWMDEGLNSFVEYMTEELFDNKFPTRKGAAYTITDYMRLPKDQLEPIMTNSENIVQFGPNAYSKPATGLNILRETIMGRDLFDFAFKTYAERWKFKHPTPADLFRTMEDASGEDLDWFWRGWFYDIIPCDISLDSVSAFKYDGTGKVSGRVRPARPVDAPIVPKYDDISKVRNREDKSIHFLTDQDTALQDFYWKYDRDIVKYDSTVKVPESKFELDELTGADKTDWKNKFIYELYFTNKGGLVMPVILKFNYADGTSEIKRIPAQIWRKNEKEFSKVFIFNKEVSSIQLDPYRETADIDESNNAWPIMPAPSKLELFKMKKEVRGQSSGLNPMQAFKSL